MRRKSLSPKRSEDDEFGNILALLASANNTRTESDQASTHLQQRKLDIEERKIALNEKMFEQQQLVMNKMLDVMLSAFEKSNN